MANNQTAFWMTSFCGGVDFCFLCSIFSAELGWWRIEQHELGFTFILKLCMCETRKLL